MQWWSSWGWEGSYVGLLLDWLRLRRAHDQLRVSEEGMSLAAIAAKLRFWVWDIPRDEVRASESDSSSGNWRSARPVRFDQFIDVLHPDDRALLRQAIRGTLRATDNRNGISSDVAGFDCALDRREGQIEFDYYGKPRQLRAIWVGLSLNVGGLKTELAT